MSQLKFHWFLPTNGGDGRQVVGGGHGVEAGASSRGATVPYLGQVARSAEQLGFEAALTPTGAWCEDAWVTTAMLSSVTERLKFLVAFRPGLTSPFLAAQMAGTFQNLSGGRLLLNVVTGGESREQRMFGDFLDKEERYARCDEFLTIVRELWHGRDRHLRGRAPARRGRHADPAARPGPRDLLRRLVRGGRPGRGPARGCLPDLGRAARGGAREGRVGPHAGGRGRPGRRAALRRAAAHHRPRHLGGGVGGGRPAARRDQRGGRSPGCRPGSGRASPSARLGCSTSTTACEDALEIHPNLWAGVGLVRGGAGTAMVGSHTEIADLVEQYATQSASRSSCSPATRTSRRRTGSARACCPSWGGAASGRTPPRSRPRPRCLSALPPGRPREHRRRRRQPQAGLPDPRRRDVRRPRAVGSEPDLVVDLAELGARLLDWQDPGLVDLVAEVGAADLVVVASPTYKATYTGLLKLFLDRFATDGLRGVAVPLMLGAGPAHALAPELTLRPVLTEIGGTTVRGHYVLDSRYDDPAAYADVARPGAAGGRPRAGPPHDLDPPSPPTRTSTPRGCARRSGSSRAASSRWRPRSTGS